MGVAEVISEVVEGLTSGIVAYGTAIGSGISNIVTSMMFTTSGETTELSSYFVMVLVFASIAICTGLTTLIFTWLGNLGGGR